MRRVGVRDDLDRLAGRVHRVLDLGRRVDGNPGVVAAVETQHRRVDARDDVHRRPVALMIGPRHRAVPCDGGLEIAIVSGVHPYDASAPAETGDAELRDVRVAGGFRVRNRGVEITHHLRVRHLAHDVLHQRVRVRDLRRVSLARIELRRDREVTQLGEAPADILDPFVDAEYFLHDEDRGQCATVSGHGAIRRNLAVLHAYLHLAGDQSFRGRRDRLRRNRERGQREPGAERRHEKTAAIHGSGFAARALQFGIDDERQGAHPPYS